MDANDARAIKRLLFEAYVLKLATKVSKTDEDFNKGYAWGIEAVGAKIGVPVSVMWEVTELAKEWADLKCPGIASNDECQVDCDDCRIAACKLIN